MHQKWLVAGLPGPSGNVHLHSVYTDVSTAHFQRQCRSVYFVLIYCHVTVPVAGRPSGYDAIRHPAVDRVVHDVIWLMRILL